MFQKPSKKISIVIPVFDEEKNVGYLIEFLLKNNLIDEIICVNDGSTDKSLKILETFKNKIKLVSFKKNRGKGYALSEGIKKAKGEIVVFLDADLINLTEKHIKDLLSPILFGNKKAVLGFGTPSKNHFFATRSWVKNVTGQRAYYKKDLLSYLTKIAKTKYGVEIYLSSLFSEKDTKMVPLIKLTHLWKHQKHKPRKAIKQYISMGAEVASEMGREKIRKNKAAFVKIKNAELKTISELTDEIKSMSPTKKSTFRFLAKFYPILPIFISFIILTTYLFLSNPKSVEVLPIPVQNELKKFIVMKADLTNISSMFNLSQIKFFQ
ncbi:MAG: glycosyltransferase family 2 protein [Candidatus Levybacteria bacterium]|nr:glycosyltransferase family 2 protein [Candidatus Levybacteria bacterium]